MDAFTEEKMDFFGDRHRDSRSVEEKVIDVLYEEAINAEPENWAEAEAVIDELMRRAVELADKCGFVKVIYDFVLVAAGNYGGS